MLIDLLDKNPLQINGTDVNCMKDSEKILVNINRLYLKRAQVIQDNCSKNSNDIDSAKEVKAIDEALKRTKHERQAFVMMSVKDVKSCFNARELNSLPFNSFRKISISNIERNSVHKNKRKNIKKYNGKNYDALVTGARKNKKCISNNRKRKATLG